MNEVEQMKLDVENLCRAHALLERRVMLLQRMLGMRMEYKKVGEVDAAGNFHPTPGEPVRVL